MMKKILLILLTLGVSISPFAGCASPESEPEPEEIQTSAPSAIDEASEGLLEHEWHLEAFGTVGEEDEAKKWHERIVRDAPGSPVAHGPGR